MPMGPCVAVRFFSCNVPFSSTTVSTASPIGDFMRSVITQSPPDSAISVVTAISATFWPPISTRAA